MKLKRNRMSLPFNIIGYIMLSALVLFCLFPFWLIISGSLTSEGSIARDGFRLIPGEFSLDAYKLLLYYPMTIVKAYQVSFFVTITGAFLGLFLISMSGFVLNRRDFKYRNQVSFFIYFTTLFNGGLVPWYMLMTRVFQLKNSYLALILPYLFSPFLIILMRNFMKSVPEEIVESAKIDGAGDFLIYLRLILPLSKPALATIGLFLALTYWNDWFMASLYITKVEQYPLQYFLTILLKRAEFFKSAMNTAASSVSVDLPSQSLKMATAVVVTGPIILLYPFVQKYFVSGLTIGAVKG